MKPSCKKLLEAMQRGEEISVKTSILRYGISAAGQRCSDLRLKYGIPVQDRWCSAPNGAKYLVWFLPPELQILRRDRPAKTHTLVVAHERRLPDIINREVEEQGSLFA